MDLNKLPSEAKTYWFECFKDLNTKLAKQAAKSVGDQDKDGAMERAEQMRDHFLKELTQMQDDNTKVLTIRQYLELHESCLTLFGFVDPWQAQKTFENAFAISRFTDRIAEIDKLEGDERWIELSKGILAGNMFDWGAQVVSDILESDTNFGLPEAMQRIQTRPWAVDNLDAWLERMQEGNPHECAAIFVDNSGVDVILGVLPFARELLRRGTRVIMCANTGPSLNDITCDELVKVIDVICKKCAIFNDAWNVNPGKLRIMGNGHSSPCLDLRQLPENLNEALRQCDLIIIEGMGRALHTNFYAKMKCETLKVLVIKNQWLAKSLFGGDIFSVIFKYEKP